MRVRVGWTWLWDLGALWCDTATLISTPGTVSPPCLAPCSPWGAVDAGGQISGSLEEREVRGINC